MAFHVRDSETDRMVRELARRRGVGLTEAVKLAVESQLREEARREPLCQRLQRIVAPLAAYPDVAEVDKAFFDDLSGQ